METKLKNDDFWYENPTVLWETRRLTEFFPNTNLTFDEKLNSLVRLSFYIALGLFTFYGNYLYLYIPIIIMVFTYFLHKNKKTIFTEKLENYKDYINSVHSDGAKDIKINESLETDLNDIELKNKTCSLPTLNNPFMNVNKITDRRDRPEACQYYDDEKIKDKVEKDFNYNLYRDVSDLYNKNNSQRQYYTAPSTTIPNKQTEFAKWLYLAPPTCKEDTIRCVPQTTQPPLPGKSLEYLQMID